MAIDRSIAWGQQESTSPLSTFTVQQKICKQAIDLVVAAIDVKKLKETNSQRLETMGEAFCSCSFSF